jgi:hypothetical protein
MRMSALSASLGGLYGGKSYMFKYLILDHIVPLLTLKNVVIIFLYNPEI